MCKRNKNLVCNRISTKLFLLFVRVLSPWHVCEDGVDVSMGLWDSCESQGSAQTLRLMEKSDCCLQETIAQDKWDGNGLRNGAKALQRAGVLFLIPWSTQGRALCSCLCARYHKG